MLSIQLILSLAAVAAAQDSWFSQISCGFCGASPESYPKDGLLTSMTEAIDAGWGQLVYRGPDHPEGYTGPVACNRQSSNSPNGVTCFHYTGSASGTLEDARSQLEQMWAREDPGCTPPDCRPETCRQACSEGRLRDGSGTAKIDGSMENPCSVNNGVTSCTCFNGNAGQCLVLNPE